MMLGMSFRALGVAGRSEGVVPAPANAVAFESQQVPMQGSVNATLAGDRIIPTDRNPMSHSAAEQPLPAVLCALRSTRRRRRCPDDPYRVSTN